MPLCVALHVFRVGNLLACIFKSILHAVKKIFQASLNTDKHSLPKNIVGQGPRIFAASERPRMSSDDYGHGKIVSDKKLLHLWLAKRLQVY